MPVPEDHKYLKNVRKMLFCEYPLLCIYPQRLFYVLLRDLLNSSKPFVSVPRYLCIADYFPRLLSLHLTHFCRLSPRYLLIILDI